MISWKAVRNQLFISHDGGSNDNNSTSFLVWLNWLNGLNLTYDSFPDFNFDDLKDDECLSEFHFYKHDLPLLIEVMEIPDRWSAIKEASLLD